MSTQSLVSGDNLENLNQSEGSVPKPEDSSIITSNTPPNNEKANTSGKELTEEEEEEEGKSVFGEIEGMQNEFGSKVMDAVADKYPEVVRAVTNPIFETAEEDFDKTFKPEVEKLQRKTNQELDKQARAEGVAAEKALEAGVDGFASAVPFLGPIFELVQAAGDISNALIGPAASAMQVADYGVEAFEKIKNDFFKKLGKRRAELIEPLKKLREAAQTPVTAKRNQATRRRRGGSGKKKKKRKKKNTEKIMRRIARTMRSFQRPKHRRTKRKRNNVRRTRRK